MSGKAVAYYRVSTRRQGQSGLGLEAQQEAVRRYAQAQGLELVESFTEVETGTAKRNRVEIHRAVQAAQEQDAVLLIAKLDRLSRNLYFISGLMESGVRFVACDMPEVNEMTVQIMAVVAQAEAKAISQRTKDALQAAKARGVQLGTPDNLTRQAQLAGAESNRQRAVSAYRKVSGYVSTLREQGMSLRAIARRLNEEGHRTRTGKKWRANQVRNTLQRHVKTPPV